MQMFIRDANEVDLPGIVSIYNQAALHTTAIWNDHPVDLDNRRQWLVVGQRAGFPVLVAADGSDVRGYAGFQIWRPFDGYRHTLEHSVYVHPSHHRRGIGRRLLLALIDRANARGAHVMIGAIEAANIPSIRLHESLGFQSGPQLPEVGQKFNRWLDLLFMYKLLAPA